jgi:rod shape determining protein RodA
MIRIPILSLALNLIVIALLFISWFVLISAGGGSAEVWANKQLYVGILVLLVALSVSFVQTKILYNLSYYFFLLSIGLLVIADFIGHTAMGAQRWLKIGFITIQPSEIAKIGVIMALSRYFSDMSIEQIGKVRSLVIPLLIVLIPVLIILKQPNLGTSAIITLMSGVVFFAAGVRIWIFVFVILSGAVSMPIIWNFMHDYQRKRVMTFLNPEEDLLGAGYNIMQSKIAIGSGGLYGKGLLNGSQVQLSFLPEKHTDFIFTILAEEWGFYGVIMTLLLYFGMIITIYLIAIYARNTYSKLLSIGVASMVFFHIFINLGMISGLLPPTGIPLPLLSYGRSNLITIVLSVGLVLNSNLQRKKI